MGITHAVETITPVIASALLETNVNNRNIRQTRVDQYASDMTNGAWHFSGDPIKVSETGILLDGQHRLWAVVESGVTLDFLVIRGLPDEIYTILDSGLPRAMSDVFQHEGIVNHGVVASTVRNFLGYKRDWLLDTNRMVKISRDEQVEYAMAHDDSLQWAVRVSKRTRHGIGRCSTVAWAAFALAIEEVHGREKAEEFLNPVSTGVALDHGDPRLGLRNWAIQRSTRRAANDPALQLATSILTFNKWINGKRAVQAKVWDRSTPFPKVSVG